MAEQDPPTYEELRAAYDQVMKWIISGPRKNNFVPNMSIVDGRGNGIGLQLMLLLRSVLRLLLSQHPTGIISQEGCKKTLLIQLSALGFGQQKEWFRNFFEFKPEAGGRSVLNNLMRTYHTAADASVKKLAGALRNPAMKGFGRFVGTDTDDSSVSVSRAIFRVAKDTFFKALGIHPSSFTSGVAVTPMDMSKAGIFRHFFDEIQDLASDM